MKEYLAEAARLLGDSPTGDPKEMRRYSSQLRERAERFQLIAIELDDTVDSSGLVEGVLADQIRSSGSEASEKMRGTTVRMLLALADYLDREATILADEQDHHRRALERKAEELAGNDSRQA